MTEVEKKQVFILHIVPNTVKNEDLPCCFFKIFNGRSSQSDTGDYSFTFQISRLSELVNRLENGELILVGHSMGGDIATLFCREAPENIIKGYVNVEGDITRFDVFISN